MMDKQKALRRRSATPPETSARREAALLARVVEIVEAARGHAARSVNSAMVHAYWMIGREIVEVEQAGAKRAGYGTRSSSGSPSGSPARSVAGSERELCDGFDCST